jgi:hypothetical protein
VADFVLPQTRYARSGEINIAYQVVGDGPIDLIIVPGSISHVADRRRRAIMWNTSSKLNVTLLAALLLALAIWSATPSSAQFDMPGVGGMGSGGFGRESQGSRTLQHREREPRTRERREGGGTREGSRGGGTGFSIDVGRVLEQLRQPDGETKSGGGSGRSKRDENRTKRARKDDPPGKKQDKPVPKDKKEAEEKPKKPEATPPKETKTDEDAPPPRRKKKYKEDWTITGSGESVPTVTIDCNGHKGDVDVATGVQITNNNTDERKDNYISITYFGDEKCDDCIWVQFFWTQIKVWRKDQKEPTLPKVTTVPTSGAGAHELTPIGKENTPNWGADSSSKDGPAYNGAAIQNENQDTMFDRPGSPFGVAKILDDELQDPKVTKMESTAHFETFLICDGKVCAKVSWTATYTWTPGENVGDEPKVSGPTYNVPTVSKDAKLGDDQSKALNAKYPDYGKK